MSAKERIKLTNKNFKVINYFHVKDDAVTCSEEYKQHVLSIEEKANSYDILMERGETKIIEENKKLKSKLNNMEISFEMINNDRTKFLLENKHLREYLESVKNIGQDGLGNNCIVVRKHEYDNLKEIVEKIKKIWKTKPDKWVESMYELLDDEK